MPLSVWLRLLIVGTILEIVVNVIGLITLLIPMDGDLKQEIILGVLTITAIWDVVTIAYLIWVPVAAGGAPPHHMARTSIKWGLVATSVALSCSLIAIFISASGVLGSSTMILVGGFLLLTLTSDIWTSVEVLRR